MKRLVELKAQLESGKLTEREYLRDRNAFIANNNGALP